MRLATTSADVTGALPKLSLRDAYRLRWKRRGLLWRVWRARHQLTSVVDHTDKIRPDSVLAVVVLRNECGRLPHFMNYYRDLGVDHFLVVDNGSDDGSAEILAEQAARGDLSLWRTNASYRNSRFGLDWSGWLLSKFGTGHWCLTVDVDELLVYPGMDRYGLRALTDLLERDGRDGFGALMLDLFPKGRINGHEYTAGKDPVELLGWFDSGPYRAVRQAPQGNLWLQGGARERVFFEHDPSRSPTLNKLPLVRWHWRYAYTNSTHALLPRNLNGLYGGPKGCGGDADVPSGVLLHTKFLPEVVGKSAIEQARAEHFHSPDQFDGYYASVQAGPDLWHPEARPYIGPDDLAEHGLCCAPNWP